ncbi:restriction endonuclease [Streptomyces sp. enrichment culture]|uniref:restriction endonuclease n=1 Tax=Streptomyces sp. enrichment culture TaxID=1795815 RepID=UPI003F56428C
MYVASAGSPAILWFLPLVLLASTTAGWLLATKHHRRQQSTVFQCQRSCCSPARVDGLDHREFEYLVRDLMIRDGATNVRRVGGAGDNGADVMATDPAGQLWIIQCKHRKQGLGGKMVGVQELQVLNGTGRPVHKGNVVVLVTNGAVSRRAQSAGGPMVSPSPRSSRSSTAYSWRTGSRATVRPGTCSDSRAAPPLPPSPMVNLKRLTVRANPSTRSRRPTTLGWCPGSQPRCGSTCCAHSGVASRSPAAEMGWDTSTPPRNLATG